MPKGIIFVWTGTLYKKGEGLFPFTGKVLQELKKYKLGLVTIAKQGVEAIRKQLQTSGIVHYFDCVIVDPNKTAEQYQECMKEMGLEPEDVLVVDDRTLRGINIGNQLGCETCWVQRGEYEHELPNEETGEPTYRIDSIEELPGILE